MPLYCCRSRSCWGCGKKVVGGQKSVGERETSEQERHVDNTRPNKVQSLTTTLAFSWAAAKAVRRRTIRFLKSMVKLVCLLTSRGQSHSLFQTPKRPNMTPLTKQRRCIQQSPHGARREGSQQTRDFASHFSGALLERGASRITSTTDKSIMTR